MITELEPDILECKAKWASESITKNKENAIQAVEDTTQETGEERSQNNPITGHTEGN